MLSLCIYLVKDVLGTGADLKISERGGRKPNPRKGGGAGIRLFSAAFSHFLINLLQIFQQKGGGRGPSGPSPKSAPGEVERALKK